ncbi:hypothetical protein Golomagni_05956 [Golovinomyces magnicellulatus]|nr:hypothetical protein Golomagni_05956 [Golovinomyces magnicellulatus]
MMQQNVSRRLVFVFSSLFLVSLICFLRFNSSTASAHLSRQFLLSKRNAITNHTLGFEKILVVGLPSRTDRRDGIVLQASLSDLHVEFVDGVISQEISEKAIPQTTKAKPLKGAVLGSWRAHINAVREIVERNLTSALIMEDDIDWDINLKHQLTNFAQANRALTQPLARYPSGYMDPSFPSSSTETNKALDDFPFDALPQTLEPKKSPYGDDWDLLWFGHCGMAFPTAAKTKIPKGRVMQYNDRTAPAKKHLWGFPKPFTLVDKYPDHTRAVHHVQEGVCSLAYALSQRGARKLLHQIALMDVTDAYDILLRFFCEGEHGRTKGVCMTVQPPLFGHHRPTGPLSSSSDIGNHGDGFRDKASTDMVRWSVRLNAARLLAGETEYDDQLPG